MQPQDAADAVTKALATELTKLRLAKDLSKNETATRANLAVSFVSGLEAGAKKPSVETLVKLAWVFGTTASEILSACEQSAAPPPIPRSDAPEH